MRALHATPASLFKYPAQRFGDHAAFSPSHPASLLKCAFQRRRRGMSIAPVPPGGASSVGAAPARDAAPMSLLRSFVVVVGGFYRHGAPTALGNLRLRRGVFQQAVSPKTRPPCRLEPNQLSPAHTQSSATVSGQPHMMLRDCTAWPAAPLVRLSSALRMT